MSATVFTSSVARVSFLLNMDVVIVPPFKSYRLIISAPSPMCSRAKTTLVWAPIPRYAGPSSFFEAVGSS